MLSFSISSLLYLVKNYFEFKDLKSVNIKKKIQKGISKDDLLDIMNPINLSDLVKEILVDFYCNRKTLSYISHKIGYTYQYTEELKSKGLKSISNYYN